jgi:hypothetical protein
MIEGSGELDAAPRDVGMRRRADRDLGILRDRGPRLLGPLSRD